MNACKKITLSMLFVFTFAVGDVVNGAETPSDATVVTIQGEMCGGCVKKMQGVLAKVPGIMRVEGNVTAKTMTIIPASQNAPSAKAIWEAIEKSGKKPAKLVGPEGEFAVKPKS